MTLSRRKFITTLGKTTGFVALVASLPKLAWAKWNTAAFKATDLQSAIKAKYGDLPLAESSSVKLSAPKIAENGTVVPIKVKSNLANVKNISIFVEKNPSPLVCTFHIGPNTEADIQTRIRMGESSDVIVVVEADGKLHSATQNVKVTIGGCGG